VAAWARSGELNILELYPIWDYFRSKLALRRSEERFEKYLAAADEFAWACYRPARDRALQARDKARKGRASSPLFPPDKFKGPPLVFLNSGWSTFTVPRDFAFQTGLAPAGCLSASDFAAVTRALPIPIIGVPWFQIEHLPEALAIGHEVGHDVEQDFDLALPLKTALLKALEAGQVAAHRQEAWLAWLSEVFADVYGNLAAGPAYTGCLADVLAGDPKLIEQESLPYLNRWGSYPTSTLRLLLNVEVLKQHGFPEESTRRKEAWLNAYPNHAMTAFEPDIPIVVKAVLQTRFPQWKEATLPEVLPFSPRDHKDAGEVAKKVLVPENLTQKDVRKLFAAARLAFEKDPDAYNAQQAQKQILDRVLAVREPGERAVGEEEPDWEQADREAGESLFDLLMQRQQERLGEFPAPP
jgi:hypothetical protein